jgi:hypothetical protein
MTNEISWIKLADRFVTAVEKIAESYELEEVEESDPLARELELIVTIHAEYHERLESILDFRDQLKKFKALRAMSDEAKDRSQKAAVHLQSVHGESTRAQA